MAAAFRALRTEMFNGRGGDRPNAKNIAYFLTDGTNDINADMAEPEADLTISSGTRIIPIGINMRNRYELDNIAALQGINVIEIDDEPGLIENTDNILQPVFTGKHTFILSVIDIDLFMYCFVIFHCWTKKIKTFLKTSL